MAMLAIQTNEIWTTLSDVVRRFLPACRRCCPTAKLLRRDRSLFNFGQFPSGCPEGASQSEQVSAIDKIAAQENAPDATTPLGMPNISYLCAGNPSQTLGWAIQQTG